jgi:hypothetical protein
VLLWECVPEVGEEGHSVVGVLGTNALIKEVHRWLITGVVDYS